MSYGVFLAWVVLPAWFLAAACLGLLSELGALGTRLRGAKSLGLLISIGTPVPMAAHVPFLKSVHLATGMALFSLVMAWEPGRIAGEAVRDPKRLRWLHRHLPSRVAVTERPQAIGTGPSEEVTSSPIALRCIVGGLASGRC